MRATSAPVWSPCAWTMRFFECAASRPSLSSPVGSRSKSRAGGLQLAHARRPFLDEHLHRRGVAERRAGGERVLPVQRRRVAGAERRGDAALRVGGRAVEQRALREQQDVGVLRGAPRRVQPGDAAADDEKARSQCGRSSPKDRAVIRAVRADRSCDRRCGADRSDLYPTVQIAQRPLHPCGNC